MDVGQSLTFVFADKKWIEKLLIGGIIFFLTILFSWTIVGALIGYSLIYGYMLILMRNVYAGEEQPLPSWQDWGAMMVDGFKLLMANFIWALPLALIWIPMIALAIPMGLTANEDAIAAVLGTAAVCTACLSLVYSIVLVLVTPSFSIRYAEKSDLAMALHVSKVLQFTRDHLGPVIVVVVVVMAAQIVAGFVGSLLCGIGLFFTLFWAYLVQGHLYGQLWRQELMPSPSENVLEAEAELPVLPEEAATDEL